MKRKPKRPPEYRAQENERQNLRRRLKVKLGFCLDCLEPAVLGSRCERHNTEAKLSSARYRDKKAKTRGWRYVRVKA